MVFCILWPSRNVSHLFTPAEVAGDKHRKSCERLGLDFQSKESVFLLVAVNRKALITNVGDKFDKECSLQSKQCDRSHLNLTFKRPEQTFISCNFAAKLWWMN